MAVETTVELLTPVSEVHIEVQTGSSRLNTLDGKTIGFLDNHKVNVDVLLHRLDELLRQRYQLAGTVHLDKPSAWAGVPAATMQELVEKCDAVVTGIGD